MPVRKPIAPTPLPQDFYREKAWAHIAAREGVSPRIYSDPNGIPSMGAGYALAVEVDGPNAKNPGQSTKKYVLRNLKEIGATISRDPNHPYVFTADEKKRLHAVVALLNNQSLLSKERIAKIQKIIPPWDDEHRSPMYNFFGFTLPETRTREIAEGIWPGYQKQVLNQVRAAAKARGWSDEEIEDYIAYHFRGSDLELVLTSLQYNNVPSPAAISAMLDGDLARLREEILYRSNPLSNGDAQPGISKRRRAEADLATGDPSTWTPEQQKAWKAIEAKPERQEYRERFPEATTSKRQIGARGFSPGAMRMLGLASAPLADAAQTILLKSPAVWTEDEVRTVMNGGDYWGDAGQLRRTEAQGKVRTWFRSTYGDAPQRRDRTGRPLRPAPIRSIPTAPASNTTADGNDLYRAAEEVTSEVAHVAESKGLDWAVRMLQVRNSQGAALDPQRGLAPLNPYVLVFSRASAIALTANVPRL